MATVTANETGGAGLASPWARAALVLVWATGAVHGAMTGDLEVLGAAGAGVYAVLLGGAWLLTWAQPGPLTPVRAAGVIGSALLALVIVLIAIGLLGGAPRVMWVLNFASYLLALLIPRGHPIVGGAAVVLFGGLIAGWAALTGQPGEGVGEMLTVPVTAAAIGYTWYLVLGYIVRRERRARTGAELATLAIEAAELAEEDYVARMTDIAADAAPLLRRLATEGTVSEDLLERVVGVEADLRDRIRASDLYQEDLVAAVSAARARGIRVTLLGAADLRGARISSALAQRAAALLTRPDLRAATVRRIPAGRGAELSVLLEDADGGFARWELDADGDEVARDAAASPGAGAP